MGEGVNFFPQRGKFPPPAGVAYSAPPDPQLDLRRLLLTEGGRREGWREGKWEERGEGEGEGRGGKGRGGREV